MTEYRHSLDRQHVTSDDAMRMYRAWARLGREMIGRPLSLYEAAGARMAERVAEGLTGSWNPSGIASDVSQECVDLFADLLRVPAASAVEAVAELDAPDTLPTSLEAALSAAAPATDVTRVDVDQEIAVAQRRDLAVRAGFDADDPVLELPQTHPGAPFLLPARVLDASQGWAAWFIPRAVAWKLMEDACELGHLPDEVMDAFEPVSVGTGDVLVTLLASDYRASDFGVTQEIGLTLSVTPRGTGLPDLGQIFLRLVVTDAYSLAAARQIWGIRKDLWNNAAAKTPRGRFEAAYAGERVRFGHWALRPDKVAPPDTLQVEFPRFGTGRSDRIPGLVYSMVEPHGPPPAPIAPGCSILTRSGTGEGVQFGGKVKLHLPESREAGQAAGCLCAGGMACLCDTLRGLGLNRRPPAANGWTERMRCTLDEPVTVAATPPNGASG